MTDEIAVDPSALLTEAGRIDHVAGRVDEARNAVDAMNLGGGAFGLMCSFLVSPAMLVTSVAANTMAETASMLRREADTLREIAREFERFEDGVGADLRALSAEVDR